MKKNQLIILLLLPITIFAESKFSSEAHGSSSLIKSDVGFGYSAGLSYEASSRIN